LPTATGTKTDPLDVDDLLSGPDFGPDPEDDDVAVEKEVMEADESSEAEPDDTAARPATQVAQQSSSCARAFTISLRQPVLASGALAERQALGSAAYFRSWQMKEL
jgi:hypothetical protein